MKLVMRAGVLGSLLMASAFVASCGSSSDDAANTPETVSTSPAVDSEESETSTAVAADPSSLLSEFAAAWDAGDWEAMSALASPGVIEVAKEWRQEGGNASEGLSAVSDECIKAGGTGCEFLYAPPEGSGLIFQLDYSDVDGVLAVTNLVFGGDAG